MYILFYTYICNRSQLQYLLKGISLHDNTLSTYVHTIYCYSVIDKTTPLVHYVNIDHFFLL